MISHRRKQRTNLSVLAEQLRAAATERLAQETPPKANPVQPTKPAPEPAQPKPAKTAKPSKREVAMGGSGAVDQALRKKALQFIDFRRLLTS